MAIVVVGEPHFKHDGKRNRKVVDCVCDCGTKFTTRVTQNPTSCGCGGRFKVVHGGSFGSTYASWSAMKERCLNPNTESFRRYGGRKITVCDRWKNSFENFLEDMGERPEGCSIDRKNVNGNYEAGNCRWATPRQQSNNRRNSLYMTIDGKTMTMAEWCRLAGIRRSLAHMRYKKLGWTAKESIFGRPKNDSVK